MSNDYIKGMEIPCLDHGFVRVVDLMGNDSAIVQAARVSYGIGTKTKNEDRGLIRHLMRNWHTSPFEMNEIKLHVKLPVFVARQWIRHRTANVNEYSARYSILDNEFYIPEIEDIQPQSKTNKQGRDGDFSDTVRAGMKRHIEYASNEAYTSYETLLHGWPWFDEEGNELSPKDSPDVHGKELGMAREMARMVVPVNIYTQWYWKVDLHNLFHFLKLRADPHAQKEIRVYAEAICKIVQAWCPVAYEAFEDYRLKAVNLSAAEVEVFKQMIAQDPFRFNSIVEQQPTLGDRERSEFLARFLP